MHAHVLILNAFEAAAFITGFAYWRKLKNSYWRFFPVYLLCIFLCEMTGKLLNSLDMLTANRHLYEWFVIPMEFFFFFWLFYRSFAEAKDKLWAIGSCIVFSCCWLFDELYILPHGYKYHSFTYTSGVVLLLMLIILYFIRVARSDDAIRSIRSNTLFWVCVGLLLFFVGSYPYYGLRDFLLTHRTVGEMYQYVAYTLDYFMYTTFMLAIIWGTPGK
jgi:hypothetical protein